MHCNPRDSTQAPPKRPRRGGNNHQGLFKKGKGEEKKMQIDKEEMDAILAMYEVAICEGQETDAMIHLVERIKKEKPK